MYKSLILSAWNNYVRVVFRGPYGRVINKPDNTWMTHGAAIHQLMIAYFSGWVLTTIKLPYQWRWNRKTLRESASAGDMEHMWAPHRPEIAWAQHCNLLQTKTNKLTHVATVAFSLSSPAALSCGSVWQGCNAPPPPLYTCSAHIHWTRQVFFQGKNSRKLHKH